LRDWERRWAFAGVAISGYWEANVGFWDGKDGTSGNSHLFEVGITPVFIFAADNASQTPMYLEAAIGIHLLSEDGIADQELGTHFQFGDHVGVGKRFGTDGRYDVGLRVYHYSNGSTADPNDGINFATIRFAWVF
jgi:hypothetical protein